MASSAMIAATQPLTCPSCDGPVDVKSRHVTIAGSLIRVFCSAACLTTDAAPPAAVIVEPAAQRRSRWPHVFGVTVGLGLLVLEGGLGANDEAAPPTPPPVVAAAAPAPTEVAPVANEEDEARKRDDEALMGELTRDAWFHPIAGPKRRMPKNHSQAFGAERLGDRPAECFSGHCGVDIAGGLWGERVRAVHDGVVDRVNRGPNEERGGVYVKIAHRDGTVFTQYFHLAAVPRWIQAGTVVKAGQVIGLLGDTGVKHSAPHLHFAISVKPSAKAPERYLDPESLIAIWPLWIVDEEAGPTRISTHEPPGMPARGRSRGKRAQPAAPAAATEDTDTPPEPAGDEAQPAEPAPAPPETAPASPGP